jgi:hypothetical protein
MRREAESSEAQAVVEGQPVPMESLSVRSMNFGQAWRTADVPEISFSLKVPMSAFVTFLEEGDRLAALIDDTKRFPDPADALDRALRDSNFPGAADAMRNPVLAEELARFFAYEFLLRRLGDGPPAAEPGFILNSVDRIAVRPEELRIEGKGRAAGIAVAYQDI